MDNKTLEYLGGKVDKVRNLKNTIAAVTIQKNYIEKEGMVGVRLASYGSMTLPNHICTDIRAAALNAIDNYIGSLQNQIDEI